MSTLIRSTIDANLAASKALPAAGAAASSASFNIGTSVPETFQAQILAPATTALVDTKTITYVFEDSADNTTFAAIAELASLVQTGAGGTGAAAATRTVYFPPSVRQYVRVTATVLAAGGDSTA